MPPAAARQRLLIFCNLDFRQIDDPQFGQKMAAEVERARRAGVAGLKILKDLGLTAKDGTATPPRAVPETAVNSSNGSQAIRAMPTIRRHSSANGGLSRCRRR